MPPPKAGQILLGACLLFGGAPCLAQSPEPAPTLYQPKIAAQVPPMRVEVIDGVRFRDIETGNVFRLSGIETCAPGQVAKLDRQPWPCGTMATAWLVNTTLNKWLACVTVRETENERFARCASASYPDLAAAMLRDGLAVLSPATSQEPAIRDYLLAEHLARKAYRGLWSSVFQMPWEWRTDHGDELRAAAAERARP